MHYHLLNWIWYFNTVSRRVLRWEWGGSASRALTLRKGGDLPYSPTLTTRTSEEYTPTVPYSDSYHTKRVGMTHSHNTIALSYRIQECKMVNEGLTCQTSESILTPSPLLGNAKILNSLVTGESTHFSTSVMVYLYYKLKSQCTLYNKVWLSHTMYKCKKKTNESEVIRTHHSGIQRQCMYRNLKFLDMKSSQISLKNLYKYHELVLYCTVLYCTVLYCTVLYCTVLVL